MRISFYTSVIIKWASIKIILDYCVMGNSRESKHSQLENEKWISEKMLTNDKGFNLENDQKNVKIVNIFFCENFPLYSILQGWLVSHWKQLWSVLVDNKIII